MGERQANTHFNSFKDFLAFEEHSDIRYEYYNGEVFAMAGTTLVHNRLVNNAADVLKAVFRPKGCHIYTESVKLEVIRDSYYPYPDVMVTCHELDKQGKYSIKNPVVLVEVLSKSTAELDREFKLQRYKKLPSLQYYLLVSQDKYLLELYGRTDNPSIWTYQSFDKLADKIRLDRLDCQMSVADIYEDISFEPEMAGNVAV